MSCIVYLMISVYCLLTICLLLLSFFLFFIVFLVFKCCVFYRIGITIPESNELFIFPKIKEFFKKEVFIWFWNGNIYILFPILFICHFLFFSCFTLLLFFCYYLSSFSSSSESVIFLLHFFYLIFSSFIFYYVTLRCLIFFLLLFHWLFFFLLTKSYLITSYHVVLFLFLDWLGSVVCYYVSCWSVL